MKRTTSGFTIVELLIVIVVIGILAAITLVAFSGVQTRARDAERVSEMNTIKKKLETFYVLNGHYPSSARVANATWRLDNLELDGNTSRAPNGNTIGYCWSSTPGHYCYVAYRPAGGPAGDCVGGADPDEKCVRYTLSYRLESDPSTRVEIASSNRP